MRAHNVIIISSGRANYAASGALDALVRQVRALKKNPILVLGPDGDDLLRSCVELEACDLAFDPNFSGDVFSSVKAGLLATNGPAFVVVLDETQLEPSTWQHIESELRIETEAHVIRPVTRNSDSAVYPQLITASGVEALRDLPAVTPWTNATEIHTRCLEIDEAKIASGFSALP